MSGSQPADTQPSEGSNTSLAAALEADLAAGGAAPAIADQPNDQGDNQAASPATEDQAPAGETRESLLDVTRRAAAEPATDEADSEGKSEAKDESEPAKAAEDDTKADGDKTADDESEDDPPPFHTHPRWQKVKRERTELRQQVEALAPDAQSFRAIQDYMARNELAPDEVRQGFAIMAALKNDPAAAWELMEPYVRQVQAHLGQELPDDLREKVDTGLIDEDTARETARLRNAVAFREQRATRAAERTQAEQTAAAAQAAQQAVVTAVDTWFEAQQADPDFAAIAPHLEGAILRTQRAWTQQGRSYSTPELAVKVAQEAYAATRKLLAPKRQEIRSTPSSPPPVAAQSGRPGSLKEALRLNLATAG